MHKMIKNWIILFFLMFNFSSLALAMGAKRPISNSALNSLPIPAPIPKLPSLPPIDSPYVERIKEIAATSNCASYNWKNRGRAPAGYIKGVALSFARSLCRFKNSRETPNGLSDLLSMANTNKANTDALSYYQNKFNTLNIDINLVGAEPIRAIYSLGMGLGMRESSGSYCEGWDKSAGANRTSSAAEAGLFQTSYDSIVLSPELLKLYNEYRTTNSNRCFLEVFKEEASCSNSSTLGTGVGADYQKFNKACPAFATEYAMAMLRIQRSHYGPINRREAEVIQSCNLLLKEVETLIENDPRNACDDID